MGDFVDGLVVAIEGFEDGVFFVAQIKVGFKGARFLVFRGGESEVGEVVEDLGSVGDEGGSVTNEIMAAGGGGAVDGAGDGVDLAAGFGGKIGGDEGAGAGGALDNEEGAGPMGHDAVALRKGLAVGRSLEGELGDDGAMAIGDFFGEGEVLRRIELHESGSEDANGATFCGNCSLMGGGIDAAGQPGDDGQSGPGELEGKLAGGFAAVVCEFAGAHDADGVKVAFLQPSPDVEDGGGVEGVAEGSGVFIILPGQDLNIAFFGEGDFGRRVGEVFPIGDDFGDSRSDAFDLLEGCVGLIESFDGGTEVLYKAPYFHRAGFGKLIEGDEGFGFSHGGQVSTGRVVRGRGSRSNRRGLRDKSPDRFEGGPGVARRI